MMDEELEKEKQCQKELEKEVNKVVFTLYYNNSSVISCLLFFLFWITNNSLFLVSAMWADCKYAVEVGRAEKREGQYQ